MPPVNVLVAFTVETREPPAMVSPPVDTLMSLVRRPPVKVLVAVLIWNREPLVRVSPFPDRSPPLALRDPKYVLVAVPCISMLPPMTVEVALPELPLIETLPLTVSSTVGLGVPIPTLPCESIVSAVDVAPNAVVVDMRNRGESCEEDAEMERRALGVLVAPNETNPVLNTVRAEVDPEETKFPSAPNILVEVPTTVK